MSSKNGSGGNKAKDVLKSILSHHNSAPKMMNVNEIELEDQINNIDLGVPAVAVAAASPPTSPNPNKIKSGGSSEYYSNKKLLAKSISMQEADDKYMENIMLAKDRRTSWQQVRSQRSFVPSLSAICK